MKKDLGSVQVLGVPYFVHTGNAADFPTLHDCDAYCDTSVKDIAVDDMEMDVGQRGAKADLTRHQRKCLRHELIHAFLYESGLAENSWARNEEVVDWIAIQAPKLLRAFEELRCMEEGD